MGKMNESDGICFNYQGHKMNPTITINGHTLMWGARTYIMGILNLTPDSFSGDGLVVKDALATEDRIDIDAILEKARLFVDNGVDIIDVGGESTRPGAQFVSANEEMERVIPVITALTSNFDVIVSIDTYKASVAEAAIQNGANLVNDVWGFHADPGLAAVVAKHHIPVILMHNRSSWANAEIKERLGGRYVGIPYENLVEDIKRELIESIEIAHEAGIPDEQIILDPGIGFGKSVEQNLELVNRLGEIRTLGYPVLLGPSRKSFIGYTLNLPPDQRLEGTAAAVAVGITRGADIVRVHDVMFMSRVVRMTDAIVRRRSIYKNTYPPIGKETYPK
jgi:dihydropteroate synthase